MNDDLRSEILRRKYGGQSGRDIARELLGLPDDEIDRLVADGVLELAPPAG